MPIKNQQDDVFDVIHSLTKTEKRYFKSEFSKRSEYGATYHHLFDAVLSLKSYNQTELLRTLANHDMINNLHVAKGYLHKQLKQCLVDYHSVNNPAAELRETLQYIEILKGKRLYKMAYKILKKVKAQAFKCELFQLYTTACTKELDFVYIFSNNTYKEASGIMEEIRAAYNCELELIELNNLFIQIIETVLYKGDTTESTAEHFLQDPLLRNINSLHSNGAKSLACSHKAFLYQVQKQTEKQLDCLDQAIEYISQTPELKNIHSTTIYESLFYKSFSALKAGYYDVYVDTLESLQDFFQNLSTSNKERHASQYKLTMHIFKLIPLLFHSANAQAGEQLFTEFTQYISKYKSELSIAYLPELYLNVAAGYYTMGKSNLALENINHVLNATTKGLRKDIRIQAHLLLLAIHMDEQNFDIIPYIIRSIQRDKNSYIAEPKVQKVIFRILRKAASAPDESNRVKYYSDLYKSVELTSDQDMSSKSFSWSIWLQAKSKKSNYRDEIQQRHQWEKSLVQRIMKIRL